MLSGSSPRRVSALIGYCTADCFSADSIHIRLLHGSIRHILDETGQYVLICPSPWTEGG